MHNSQPDRLDTSSRFRLSRAEIILLVFNCAYIGVGMGVSFVGGNDEFLMYVGVLGVLLVAVSAFHLRVRLPLAALWGLSIWGIAHMTGGLLPVPESWPTGEHTSVLYNLWLIPGLLKFDQLVHAYGFGLVTWICWIGLKRAFEHRDVQVRPSLGLLTLCVAGGMGFGAANEVVEFVATVVMPETNVGGYENTGWDLVANLVGCPVAATLVYLGEKRSEVTR